MAAGLHLDYLTVGHVTVDVLEDGTRQPGGSAFYSALQAARLGLRTQILTRGDAVEIEGLLAPYADELSLRVLPAAQTTVLATSGEGAKRRQRLLAWAGRLPEELRLESQIVHLAPVVRELPDRWHGEWGLLGLTAQGVVREWSPPGAPEPAPGAELALPSLPAGAPPERQEGERARADGERMRRLGAVCDAIVLSELESRVCGELITAARARDSLVAITAGPRPVTMHAGAVTEEVAVTPVPPHAAASDVGAGDVFAAALFAELAGGSGPRAAVEFAAAAAAVRMGAPGAEAIADRSAIERHMRASAGQRAAAVSAQRRASATSMSAERRSFESSRAHPQTCAASSRLPPTGARCTCEICACGAVSRTALVSGPMNTSPASKPPPRSPTGNSPESPVWSMTAAICAASSRAPST